MLNKKLIRVWIIILASLLIFALFFVIWEYGLFNNKHKIIVTVQRGDVLFTGSDANQIGISGQREIQVNDVIQTFDGEAIVSVDEDFLIWIKPDSILSISKFDTSSIVASLKDGVAWYMHINGTSAAQFVMETPLSTTTPAGTKFFATYDSLRRETTSFVAQGKIFVRDEFEELLLVPFEKSFKTDTNGLRKIALTQEDKNMISAQLQKDYAVLSAIRMQEIKKHGIALNIIKSKYNLTDANIQDVIEKIDRGEVDIEDLIEQSPVPIPNLHKIRILNNEAKTTLFTKNAVDARTS